MERLILGTVRGSGKSDSNCLGTDTPDLADKGQRQSELRRRTALALLGKLNSYNKFF